MRPLHVAWSALIVVPLLLLALAFWGCGLTTPTSETHTEPGGATVVQSGDGNKVATITPVIQVPPGAKTVTFSQDAR